MWCSAQGPEALLNIPALERRGRTTEKARQKIIDSDLADARYRPIGCSSRARRQIRESAIPAVSRAAETHLSIWASIPPKPAIYPKDDFGQRRFTRFGRVRQDRLVIRTKGFVTTVLTNPSGPARARPVASNGPDGLAGIIDPPRWQHGARGPEIALGDKQSKARAIPQGR